MANKYDQNAIKAYTESVLEASFLNKDKLDGNDILKLSAIEQINFMVIYLLFDAWEKELENLKSPYFNFENKEVKEAMSGFMNVVSKNISVDREKLQPLLEEACTACLNFVDEPENFLVDWFGEEVEQARFHSFIKFAKVYKDELNTFAENGGELKVERNAKLFDEIAETLGMTRVEEPETELEEGPVEEEIQVVPPTPLAQLEKESTETLNDAHAEAVPSNLGDKLSKIESIKSAISLNQKFVFIRELYNGDEERYTQTIDNLDGLNVKEEAQNFFNTQLEENTSWDIEDKEVQRLFELIERRFASN